MVGSMLDCWDTRWVEFLKIIISPKWRRHASIDASFLTAAPGGRCGYSHLTEAAHLESIKLRVAGLGFKPMPQSLCYFKDKVPSEELGMNMGTPLWYMLWEAIHSALGPQRGAWCALPGRIVTSDLGLEEHETAYGAKKGRKTFHRE